LILMRLADAIGELPPSHGMQVHRSWWVGYEAVASIEREAGRVTLRLTDGTQVPVSRTYQAAVRAANWPSVWALTRTRRSEIR
jgi:DNA-binding LytR/AlgR family response regulator